MPPEAALGLMMNLSVANAWKTIPIVQGIGLVTGGKDTFANFIPSLYGKTPSTKDQIRASLDELRNTKR